MSGTMGVVILIYIIVVGAYAILKEVGLITEEKGINPSKETMKVLKNKNSKWQ
jgi:hypothetical protein